MSLRNSFCNYSETMKRRRNLDGIRINVDKTKKEV